MLAMTQAAAATSAGERIATLLGGYQLRCHDEYDLQDAIAAVLDAHAVDYERECRLSPTSRVDFLAGGVGIEVKVDGPNSAVLRQLCRYATIPEIRELLLVTTRMRHLQLPRDIGCPLFIVAFPGLT